MSMIADKKRRLNGGESILKVRRKKNKNKTKKTEKLNQAAKKDNKKQY